MQQEIHQAAYDTQRAIERLDEIVVGVNQFTVDHDPQPELLRVDPDLGRKQAEQLAKLRQERSQPEWEAALAALKAGASSDANLMPLIINAVRAYATTGEICDALRGVFGEYQPPIF